MPDGLAAFFGGERTLSVISLRSMPAPPKGGAFGMAGKFLIALDALVTGLTACALSVTCGDTSPKGRGKNTAGNFLFVPDTLAMNFTAWLSLRGKTSPAPGEDVTVGDKRGNLARERLRGRARLTGVAPHPALRATFPRRVKALAVAATAVYRYDPTREKGVLKSPQAFQNPKIKIILPLQQRRPPPAAETGRSCWGSGQQDASAAQGTKRMLGAATRKQRGGHFQSFSTPGHPAARHAAHSTSFSALESFFREASRRKAARLSAQRSI